MIRYVSWFGTFLKSVPNHETYQTMKRTKPWKKSPKKSKNENSNQQLISKTSRPPFGLEIFFLLFFLTFLKDLNLNQSHWTDCESSADWSFSSSTQIVSGQKIESLRSDPIREWLCPTNYQSDLASDRRPIEIWSYHRIRLFDQTKAPIGHQIAIRRIFFS